LLYIYMFDGFFGYILMFDGCIQFVGANIS